MLISPRLNVALRLWSLNAVGSSRLDRRCTATAFVSHGSQARSLGILGTAPMLNAAADTAGSLAKDRPGGGERLWETGAPLAVRQLT
ncbi:hypothetical protein NOVOSPHI9U_30063 [Novosphingobium sp. 9U]|nr:hypothetical protein NOVOSPHI9U_30063 [Novosphingobium sp. 9U]